jgi:asparagine synthetase B (glutamine-hydrolysing)
MCGIIGYIGPKEVVPVLIDGLRKLEYRGYDSAGVAVVNHGAISLRRSAGKLSNLEEAIVHDPITGDYGVGHTRWATHGRPTEENAHPHRDCTGKIVVVHNGIIENYLDLKLELQRQGHKFVTETDTEIVAHLVEREMKDDGLENAVRRALMLMRGLFALVLISADDPEKIIAVRNGPPIVVGLGDGEFFVASDIPAILSHTRDVVFLGDEEMAVITRTGVSFTDFFGRPVSAATQRVLWDPIMAEKAGYKHFMLKEIFEQADGCARNDPRARLAGHRTRVPRGDEDHGSAAGADRPRDHPRVRHLVARRPGRQVPDRAARTHSGRSGLRVRVSLPESDRRRKDACRRHHAVGRDRRHARRIAGGKEGRRPEHRRLQRRRQHGNERDRGHRPTRTPAPKSAWHRPRHSRRSWWRCTSSH